jgi:Fe-S cluster assembly protein SufD
MNNLDTAQEWFDSLVYDNSVIAKAMTDNHFFEVQDQAQSSLASINIPQRKQEAWRYTDLKSLYKHQFISPDATQTQSLVEAFDDWIYSTSESYRLVMLNGQLSADLSCLPSSTAEISISGLNQINEKQRKLVSTFFAEQHAFSDDVFDVINRALIQDGFLIHIGKGVVLDKPIEILHLVTAGGQQMLAQPRSVVLLESSASALIVERFTGFSEDSYFHNSLLRIQLEDNSELQHVRLQQESNSSHHLSRLLVHQQRDSRYHLMNIATGAQWGRSDIHVELQGNQAECTMQGVYTVTDKQYNDVHLDVSHIAPHCRSELNFNGILLGAGRGVFDGRILVDKLAQKTDSQMTNHNLMLSEQAEIDSKPLLEIYADDVKCSHGATVGSIDSEQLFYCRSRGMSRHQAVRLLCEGFANRIIENIPDPLVREYAQNKVIDLFQVEGNQV